MAKKAIYYPRKDAEVASYFKNVTEVLTKLSAKYQVDPVLLALLISYSTEIPVVKGRADADQLQAKASVKLKDEFLLKIRRVLLRELRRVADLPDFNEVDAMDLGIRKENKTRSRENLKAAILSIKLIPGEVSIDWYKGKMDGVAIYCALDGKNFTQIGIDLRSPFQDKRQNIAVGVPEVRYYKLRYILGDEQVGQFSDVSSITVMI
jgi:hypothetical protein